MMDLIMVDLIFVRLLIYLFYIIFFICRSLYIQFQMLKLYLKQYFF